MKLALQLSCYNGAKYLPTLFASLKTQTVGDWQLYVLDNASDAENQHAIAEAVAESGLPITLSRVEKNIGFAGAHNFLFNQHQAGSDFVQLLNDDAWLEPTFLESLLAYLETHPTCTAVSGKILRWDFDARDTASRGRTVIVDSLGLGRDRFGRVFDIASGQPDPAPTVTDVRRVFGVSGCLPMYRVRAVQDVSLDGLLFDQTFRIYKEDVELAYRLRAAGYEAATVPMAVAYHRRTLSSQPGLTQSLAKSGNENEYYSYRNHLWILMMHFRVRDVFWSRLGVLPYEIAKAGYWLVCRPSFLSRAWSETWNNRAWLAEKRNWIKTKRRLGRSPKAMTVGESPTQVCVLLVSHNDLNEACLLSLAAVKRASALRLAFVVVDNNSTEYRANELVAAHLPEAWCLLRHGDFGYGRSNVRAAEQVAAEYYFILNPDTDLPDPLVIDRAYAYLKAHPEIGVLAPKIEYPDGRLQETCRRFPAWYMPLIQRTALQKTAFGRRYVDAFLLRDYDHRTPREVDWAQGSALMVDAAVWQRLNGYDHRFWMYFEDIDLCRRVRALGRSVVYQPEIVIRHAYAKESAKYASWLVSLVRNRMARAHIASWLKYLWKWKL